jgi:hypothetical protein
LRHAGDEKQFLPLEQVVDTMLHELSHNVFSEHDSNFHALWDQLRQEYEGLIRKGYTGEGFLSDGKRLGGKRMSRDEARRMARIAAEKRRTLYSGSGQKLGGAPVRAGADIRDVIIGAIERRNTVLKGCGSGGRRNEKEVKAIADQATHNGFKTKAEEDEANEQAISQAVWELVQEEEKEKYGADYVPPTAANPTGNGGGKLGAAATIKGDQNATKRLASSSLEQGVRKDRRAPSSVSSAKTSSSSLTSAPATAPASSQSSQSSPKPKVPAETPYWACPICTCHNSLTYLCCDACTTERPASVTRELAKSSGSAVPAAPNTSTKSTTWTCRRCTTLMEHKWWTCSTCGAMKDSS